MRITHNLMADRVLANLWNTQRRLIRYHNQGSSGKRVNVPSEDPAATMAIMRYKSSLTELQRHHSNTAEAVEWLTVTDEAIMHLQENLHRTREIAILGANSSLPDDARQAYVAELDEIIKQVVTLGNTTYDGRYVFSGHKTTTKAFEYEVDADDNSFVNYQGDDGIIQREIGQGSTVEINLLGDELFGFRDSGENEGQGVFDILISLRDALADPDGATVVSEELIGRLAEVHEGVNRLQVKLGATVRRAEQVQEQLADLSVTMENLLADIEEADIAEVSLRLNAAEVSYQYALAVGARIIQPSLLEYLR